MPVLLEGPKSAESGISRVRWISKRTLPERTNDSSFR